MRSKLPILGVIIVLAAGYMAAQPFRQSSPQTTASAPAPPRTPLRWNEPVPLQVTSSQDASPASISAAPGETSERPSFDRIPRIQASGEFAALADPPPQLAPQYEAPRAESLVGRDPFEEPAPAAYHGPVAAPVSSEQVATAPSGSSPIQWPETPRIPRGEERLASLPTTQPTHPSAGSPRVHRVVDGDSLPRLAERYLGSASRYLEIYEANRDLLASPDLLPLGVKLVIPAGTTQPQPTSYQQSTSQQTYAPQGDTQGPTHPPPAQRGLVPIGGI